MQKFLTRKKLIIAGIVAILVIAVPVLIFVLGGSDQVMAVNEKVPDRDIPTAILVWLDENMHTEGYGAFYTEGYFYFVARMGQKPTGGFSVSLGEASLTRGEAVVKVEFDSPNPWDIVTQVITYPRMVVRLAYSPEPPENAMFISPRGSVIARVKVVNLDQRE